jgi:hypothetical protein
MEVGGNINLKWFIILFNMYPLLHVTFIVLLGLGRWSGSFADHVVGMNLFLTTRRAIFKPWDTILKHLEHCWTSQQMSKVFRYVYRCMPWLVYSPSLLYLSSSRKSLCVPDVCIIWIISCCCLAYLASVLCSFSMFTFNINLFLCHLNQIICRPLACVHHRFTVVLY